MPARAPLAAASPPPRQARSRATRRRLLDACIACLVDGGLAAATTSQVARRAGVSQGALFKHFPSKQALLGAAVEQLFAELVAEGRRELARSGDAADPVAEVVAVLWRIFTRPALQAAFELMAVGRTDPALRGVLGAVQQRHRDQLRRAAAELFPEPAARPGFDAGLDAVLSALQGASLGALVLDDPQADARRLAFLEDVVRRLLAPENPRWT